MSSLSRFQFPLLGCSYVMIAIAQKEDLGLLPVYVITALAVAI
ncbi:MAG: hypothetical protein V7L20_02370 [Nostoc sp.]